MPQATLHFDGFPPHMQLLLLCAGARPADREAVERVAAAASVPGLDWRAFLTAVHVHRVAPLVSAMLHAAAPSALPAEIRDVLQQRAVRNAFAAMRAAAELDRIDRAFEAAGFPLCTLKGLGLSETLYGNPAVRHVGDLDLLIATPEVSAQQELLIGLGYIRTNPPGRLTPRRIRSYVRFWKDFTFAPAPGEFDPARGLFDVDLHWRLANHRLHPVNRVLDGATFERRTVYGHSLRTLPAEDQFLHCAAHGVADLFTHLKSLADVAGFLRLFSPAALDAALARAAGLGLLEQVSAAVHLANDWMACGVTSARLTPRDEPLVRHVRARVGALLVAQGFLTSRDYVSPAAWTRLEALLVPGVAARLETARRFVWRPRIWSSVELPDTLFWLYPVVGVLLPPRRHTPLPPPPTRAQR